jgi:hypothetical protein
VRLSIDPRSLRSFYTALAKAGLEPPTSPGEIGECFLRLLIAGIDHDLVGSGTWLTRIFASAPDRAACDDDEREA